LILQLKEELSVHGSDEEADDPPEVDSDEDPSDDDAEKHNHEEVCVSMFYFISIF
jgi:hypothetical protein